MSDTTEGAGWILFAGIMLLVVATLNIIWGIAAIDDANFFINDTHYMVSSLNTWGWIILIIGGLQMIAAFSVWAGGEYGRWIGIITACASAIGALMSIPAYPFWSLAIFAIDILIIYGLAAYGGQRTTTV